MTTVLSHRELPSKWNLHAEQYACLYEQTEEGFYLSPVYIHKYLYKSESVCVTG